MKTFFIFFQVFLAKHKQEDKVYAVKVLTKAAIRKRNEACQFFVFCGPFPLMIQKDLGLAKTSCDSFEISLNYIISSSKAGALSMIMIIERVLSLLKESPLK